MPRTPAPRTPAPRPPAHRSDPALAPEPLARPLEDVVGDIRDRLTVLINAAQVIRLSAREDDVRVQSVLRLIAQQVESLGGWPTSSAGPRTRTPPRTATAHRTRGTPTPERPPRPRPGNPRHGSHRSTTEAGTPAGHRNPAARALPVLRSSPVSP